ncbi:MAG: ADP-ribosylglycohydrolase family protein [Clostridia bacterium]|nr:ADP-ribosylglycohydrolase family protein [Clostridia bacterium]
MKKIDYNKFYDKVYGCFVGKAVVGNIGAPYEGMKMPTELEYDPEMVNLSLPNDDLDLQVLWLDVAEKKGADFTSYDLLKQFCENCTYSPGEYAIMRKNFHRAIYPPYSGEFCNDFYTEGMGCPIRSEVWACLAVGNDELAMEFAGRDGQLDHFGESILAEKYLAALESRAFFSNDMRALIVDTLEVLPENSKFRTLVCDTVEYCDKYNDIKKVLSAILFKYGHPDCTNMYQNMGITIACLILGGGDIIKTGMMALNCGFDTDCTCATAGAIIGIMRGADELIKAYGLDEVTYTLAVTSHRRSNKICDLAEDIAHLAVEFAKNVNNAVEFENAPEVAFEFDKKADFTMRADYKDMDPSVTLGGKCDVTLTFANNTEKDAFLECSLTTDSGLEISLPRFSLSVPAFSQKTVAVEVSLDINADTVCDTNIIKVTAQNNGKNVISSDFGVSAAEPWKLCGPFWRTEPITNTETVLKNLKEKKHPYSPTVKELSIIPGNWKDKQRHYHLNFYPDTELEYLPLEALFTPVSDSTEYVQTLVQTPRDSFNVSDFTGFQGPCTVYLSRIIVMKEDRELFIQVGHTCPFTLYVNGEVVAKRDNCDCWTAENVHVPDVVLKKGENRIALRITRVNDQAKFNLTFADGAACAAHYTDLVSKNPMKFQD